MDRDAASAVRARAASRSLPGQGDTISGMSGHEAQRRVGDAILMERAADALQRRFHESTLRFSGDKIEASYRALGILRELAAELRHEARHLGTGFVTKSGRVLTEDEIRKLADEAERGYDVDTLVPRMARGVPQSPGAGGNPGGDPGPGAGDGRVGVPDPERE